MSKKVLVAYASKYGSTEQIAERIGLRLKKAGLDVDIRPVKAVIDPSAYSALLLGSGVYAGFCLKPAADFLKKQESALSKMPVWLFSGGPTGEGDPSEMMDGYTLPDNLKEVAERIIPKGVAFFHGAIDMDKLKFAEKLIIRALKAPLGDFRDWDMIHAWADRVASALK
jgi:menaquinone-dependent protoporphyrinogen oxidase